MKKSILSAAITVAVCSIQPVLAEEMIDTQQNEISAVTADVQKPVETIDSWVRGFEDKHGITMGNAVKNRTFFFGSSPVRVGPLDPAYGKELQIAYEKAMLNMQANFILQTYGTMLVENVIDFYENDSTNAHEFDPVKIKEQAVSGQIEQIYDKFLQVVDNKLDAMLVEQGVPESEIKTMQVEQKKTVFKDNFRKKMVKKATQNMSGLVPIQTKLVTREVLGKTAVELGVIAVQSEKTTQFAADIVKNRSTAVKGKGSSIKEIIPSKDVDFMDEFGFRMVYDTQGRPMLIAYGRSSVVTKTSSPSRMLRKIDSAKNKARMTAEAMIGGFIKSNIQASDENIQESIDEEIATKLSDIEGNQVVSSTEGVQDMGETIDIAIRKIQSKSQFKLRGTSQVRNWEFQDDKGIIHVGSVVAWTYGQLENANNIANKKVNSSSVKSSTSTQTQVIQESRQSKMVNSIDDF